VPRTEGQLPGSAPVAGPARVAGSVAGSAPVAGPAPVALDAALAVAVATEQIIERFDYSRVGKEWAVVKLLARLGGELGAPADARLVVARDPEEVSFQARACTLERRLLGSTRRSAGGSELLWRASFAVPIEVVECREALFSLRADGLALALPAPRVRIVTPRTLALAPRARDREAGAPGWYELAHARRRLVALATVVAVTASSTPAAALADAVSGGAPVSNVPGGAGGSTTPTTQTVSSRSKAPGPSDIARGGKHAGAGASGHAGARGAGGFSSTGRSSGGSGSDRAGKGKGRGTGTGTGAGRGPHHKAHKRSTSTCSPVASTTPLAIAATGPTGAPTKAPTTPTAHAKCIVAVSGPSARSHKRHGHHASGTSTPVATGSGSGATVTAGSAPTKLSGKPSRSHGAPTGTLGAWSSTPGLPAGKHRAARPPISGGAAISTLSSTPPNNLAGGVTALSPNPAGFLAPKAWTGTVMADPALTGAVTNLSGLLSNGNRPPSFLIPIYMEAGHRFGVPWEVLAAINAIESDYGRDLSTSSAGAVGWMQFEPSTWKEYGMAVDGHSEPNPYDPRDAIFSAAKYLAAAGARHDITGAIYAYNHAGWYVQDVLQRASAIAAHAQFERSAVKHGIFSVYFASGTRRPATVRYRSGVLSHYDRLIAAANMVSAANFPYLYGGGHEQPARFAPFDCSGAVSYVIQQAGYKVPTTVSGDIPIWKFPAGPGRVTIFYNPTHTYMRIGNRFFGTSGFARPGGGAGWFDVDKLPASYLSQFREVHVPRLGANSFAPVTHLRVPGARTRGSSTFGFVFSKGGLQLRSLATLSHQPGWSNAVD
jgi:uncharacterized membrane protein YgcG